MEAVDIKGLVNQEIKKVEGAVSSMTQSVTSVISSAVNAVVETFTASEGNSNTNTQEVGSKMTTTTKGAPVDKDKGSNKAKITENIDMTGTMDLVSKGAFGKLGGLLAAAEGLNSTKEAVGELPTTSSTQNYVSSASTSDSSTKKESSKDTVSYSTLRKTSDGKTRTVYGQYARENGDTTKQRSPGSSIWQDY